MTRNTAAGLRLHEQTSFRVNHDARPQAAADVQRSRRIGRDAAELGKAFCDFTNDNPSIYHAVGGLVCDLENAGFKYLSERDGWTLKKGGKYYMTRNGSSMVAFIVGGEYKPGNGVAMVAGHIDSLCLKLKPISKVPNKEGYVQLGVAPYSGALSNAWWDRDLGIGGRVLVREDSGKVVSKLAKLPWPIARIPSLAPHFGAPANGPFNKETNMVPIIGLESTAAFAENPSQSVSSTAPPLFGDAGSFAARQPPRLLHAFAKELGIKDTSSIVSWDLELFDTQMACLGGLEQDMLFGPRIDDKVCSWAGVQALINAAGNEDRVSKSSIIQLAAVFDVEEVGSLLRSGARSNFLPITIERIVDSFAAPATSTLVSQTLANSYLLSADVTHAGNPNFLSQYLPEHIPRLNVGITVSTDPNAHVTTDAVSAAILSECAVRCGQKLQIFQIRNDSRSGGTIGPSLSSMLGCRSIDAGIPQLSMHSIRATIGSLDPGLGTLMFQGFLEEFEAVDKDFRSGD